MAIIALFTTNAIGIYSRLYWDHDFVYGLIPLFDFNSEKNIPTLFSAVILTICSALLYFIGMAKKQSDSPYLAWIGLSLIFLFLAIDETGSIHERLTTITRVTFSLNGFLFYAWVVPYGVALVVFLLSYSRFLLRLPRETSIQFIVAGTIFVAGAIGLELIGGKLDEAGQTNSLAYAVLYSCEELLEMIGIAVFLNALLNFIVSWHGKLRVYLIP